MDLYGMITSHRTRIMIQCNAHGLTIDHTRIMAVPDAVTQIAGVNLAGGEIKSVRDAENMGIPEQGVQLITVDAVASLRTLRPATQKKIVLQHNAITVVAGTTGGSAMK